ncbi:hypothetical protein [Pseudacidovorax intermedius]|uniref:Uncharacterized protein n=1 Tax=Pseudacidovorax intermedius TaxID=433924 RepID=A0A370F374_9BURK|nr:hypothetical protein [Pseudacidovorax intermedius]RDI17311.1 hypothetical protein DFR41_11737 [Pseudacidovorax intermedius]
MDFLALLALAALGLHLLKRRDQQRRIVLLGAKLAPYRIEPQMETLLDGYLRWLDEADEDRRRQIWQTLCATEQSLAEQLRRFAADVAGMEAPLAQVSKLPMWLPWAQPLLSGRLLFDVRRAFAIHAKGIAAVAANEPGLADKPRAFMMSAELLLLQHTCHWFCRSKAVASARLLARHGTSYEQVLASVSPRTRSDYLALIGR